MKRRITIKKKIKRGQDFEEARKKKVNKWSTNFKK